MTFTTKRGRPKKTIANGKDLGTPELAYKRAMSLTTEALDLCLERNLITPDQHWCGVHLRWLYTLRYGAPTIRTIDPLHFGGRDLTQDNPEWRRERESEYNEAMGLLGRFGFAALALCVYNQRPALLSVTTPRLSKEAVKRLPERERELDDIRSALDVLVVKWCKKKPEIRKRKTEK